MRRKQVSASDVQAELDDFDAKLKLREEGDTLTFRRPSGERLDTDAFTDVSQV